jgi:hypothetical protein
MNNEVRCILAYSKAAVSELHESSNKTIMLPCHGAWRSPVAHLHGVQGVVGSNPIAPTEKDFRKEVFFSLIAGLSGKRWKPGWYFFACNLFSILLSCNR